MNSSQVRAKARAAMARRAAEIEQEEVESGELNLIPYLDIVTNIMLFLLASVSAGYVLGQINTTLPDHAPAAAAAAPTEPSKNPDEQSLQLVVSLTRTNIVLWSVTGLEGTVSQPKLRLPRRPAAEGEPARYDLDQLNRALYEIAARRWRGKLRARDTYEIILQADGEIPYETVVATMDAMRKRLPPPGEPEGVFLGMPAERDGGTADKPDKVPVETYDPDKHYLFPDILFSKGFE
jgi:biopolymer transport protein ExbD